MLALLSLWLGTAGEDLLALAQQPGAVLTLKPLDYLPRDVLPGLSAAITTHECWDRGVEACQNYLVARTCEADAALKAAGKSYPWASTGHTVRTFTERAQENARGASTNVKAASMSRHDIPVAAILRSDEGEHPEQERGHQVARHG